jgi:glycosyltransferase involved in cell wall biosynthesis
MVTAHCLVKNEENFIWYSILSVIDYVDNILVWDTGSTDKTIEIIKELLKIYPTKIFFKELGNVNEKEYSILRQRMLDETKSDWIFILDGDEIWWKDSISSVIKLLEKNGKDYDSIVVPTLNLVGDIFHHQEELAGQYKIGKKHGHIAIRFINKNIPGLHVFENYGKEGYADNENTPIQNRNQNKIYFLDASYIHTTHLARSSKDEEVMQRANKRKHELGISFPIDFYYPEAFFRSRPEIVPNVWMNMDFNFRLRAFIETPLKKLKRRIA